MKKVNPHLLLSVFLFCSLGSAMGQGDAPLPTKSYSLLTRAPEPDKKRIRFMKGVYTLGGPAGLGGLYFLWYKDQGLNRFHFFDDNKEWMQMDKIGHAISVYYSGKLCNGMLAWTGTNERTSFILGTLTGFTFMTVVEVMDGFSETWGFSYGDMIANAGGAGLYAVQMLAWKETRLDLKFSFHRTRYASYRPNVLGENLIQEILKDYNGQTYWLSGNLHSFLPKKIRFPKWLNLAIGYGAEGMIGGFNNLVYDSETGQVVKDFSSIQRQRQFYVSLDVDLSRIKTKSKLINGIFQSIGFIKFPAPTLEFRKNRMPTFHTFYF